MERFKKETMEPPNNIGARTIRRSKKHSWFFFFVFLSDNGEELRVMIMKPGMVWHKDQITFKIEYNVN